MDDFSKLKVQISKEQVLKDYQIGVLSRNLSLLGRKEVLLGKAKFGIFGDGKEIAQLALARNYQDGDFRSGYYRDQTLMLAAGVFSAEEFFAQLYGDTDLTNNPAHGGRLMNNHFASRSINDDGSWKNLSKKKNSSCDISPTAGQMPRLLGLALASKFYRNNKELKKQNNFSINGNEIAIGTIGDASTSEGHFFEILNAAGVLQVPLALSVWDDGYGISVEKKYQTTKQDISLLLQGFEKDNNGDGILIYKVRGWDYPGLCNAYSEGIKICREKHVPVVFHIVEMTQPLGHSTSGSHERYKSNERLQWEKDFDPLTKMREWILTEKIGTKAELVDIELKAKDEVLQARNNAMSHFLKPIIKEKDELIALINSKKCICNPINDLKINEIKSGLIKENFPIRKTNISAARKMLRHLCLSCPANNDFKAKLLKWLEEKNKENRISYSENIFSHPAKSALNIKSISENYPENPKIINGREILRDNFDALLSKNQQIVIFGEDTGKIGGVNQSLEGLQDKYGKLRVFDTGLRETSIIGKAIGLALRGFRPIAEIQYFDYLLYALQTMSDDLATTSYRTRGGQVAPVIVSTRGHRLEGVWHSGSPLSMVINSVRGMHVCVPRNMTKAAAFYNLLLECDDPALVIEPLNAYRLKEKCPVNMGEFKQELGVPEVLEEGTDITVVTYGSCVRIAQNAIEELKQFNISVELIDVQTLLPFDKYHIIAKSIKKTGKVLFFDEDVPGGATAFMMQKVLEEQNAWFYLDSAPKTLTAKEHRPAYATDGDYFSNPNAEDVFESVYAIMSESNPAKFPPIYPSLEI
jgi:pyruvate/2-oxoglutarate/acetoin dehydrogenase E1 component/TPP-dependent pyruvate/acetoin dehydrogenase alpha subunit